jgi:hypothetical protein
VHQQAAAHAAAKHTHSAGHGDGDAPHHHAAADLTDDAAPADQKANGDASTQCCASICAFALVAFGSDTLSRLMGVALALVPDSQVGSGIDPSGLKRPPRTPCIA